MNPLKKGPQIKMPDKLPGLKAPAFLTDIYRDLRDRHLLPLVAVLLVAIVAVPIALSESGGSEESTLPIASAGTGTGADLGAATRNVVIARSAPGLRSYHRRLRHLSASDPFKQQYTAPEGEEGSASGGESAPEESGSGGSPPEESGETTTGETGETGTATHQVQYLTYEIDVRIVPVSTNGVPSDAEPSIRRNLPELTSLPGRQTPALIFMQPSADGEKALMLVNSNVKAIFGEGVCASGGETCQLLALKPGMPETIVYGGNERIFRIELLKVELVPTKSPKQAPLGTNKKVK